MRALLVNPWIYDFKAFDFWNKPVGLLTLATVLNRNGLDLDLIDCMDRNHPALKVKAKTDDYGRGKYLFEVVEKPVPYSSMPRRYKRYGLPHQTFVDLLNEIKVPDVILVTSSMTYWYPAVHEAISILKNKFPKTQVILGGIYASLCPEHAQNKSGADHIITGPGENKILEVMSELDLIKTPIIVEDPMPDYSLYTRLDYVVLFTSKGCPFSCSYCAIRRLMPQVHYYQPEKVVEAIRYWATNKSVANIALFDDALLTNPHLEKILSEIISFNLNVRFHSSNGLHARFMTRDLAQLMKKAGFETMYVSLETVNEERQHATGNKVKTKEFLTAIDYLLHAGYKPKQIHVYLMVGLPCQPEEEIIESIEFCKKLDIVINLTEFSPIPGTREYAESRLPVDADPLLHNNTFFTWYYPKPRTAFLKAIRQLLNTR